MDDAITGPISAQNAPTARGVVAPAILAVYGAMLAAIAFWPTPVDADARGLLSQLTHAVPMLTYPRLEFGANILLFVPLGALLAVILPRARWLVVPLALAVTVTVECVQAVALAQRTPSFLDIVANTVGAGLGLMLVVVMTATRQSARDAGA